MVRFQRSISVVLPAFNEAANIEKAAGTARDYLAEDFARFEVIVVDDGSKDETAAIVQRMADADPRIKLVRHPRNLGYGRAIADGFAAATGELVFFTDADNQFDIRELRDFVPLADDYDAVLGFRVYRYDSVLRCILSWGYNRIVRVLFRVRVRDVDCSFKLFTRAVVDKLALESNDFFIDTEMVARTRKLGFRVIEKGVRHYPRTAGHTTVRASHIPRTLWTVAKMWFRINFPRKARERAPAAEPAPPR
jgi:glycosyltransferase involved in cell wall biosynthesis